ncbi:MAG: ATP-binding cassette domain-containing protein, partial [Verrucomicrobia bacterium]|nr:ATP-binding cassette domain-containing protein [Verrucomicrobiota bacterium]
VLPQRIPEHPGRNVEEVLHAAVADLELEDWEREARMDARRRQLEIPLGQGYDQLSSGQKRRVLLLASLLREPDLLLLDEPTNHLDLETIRWMEEVLLNHRGALLFISHDRAFVRRLGQAVIDLDRGKLTRWDCGYDRYVERKQQALEAEEKQQAVFDRKLAQEEAWIRQGIKARRTRNEGRVRRLQKMREEHRQRRGRTGDARMDLTGGGAVSGHKVISAEGIVASHEGRPLFGPFDCEILRGDRVGILGPNGCGKTTLIRTLLGKIPPEAGSVERGTNLQVAYFDQNREQLDPGATVMENAGDGHEFVTVAGQRRHIISHLKDFLFTSEQAKGPIHNLSGGERNRLLLARLFCRPFNLLVMDEPTNDLDLETLELLEEQLTNFNGTLLLVSHDRDFLDNVVTELLVFEGEGRLRSIVGGYADYEAFRERTAAAPAAPAAPAPARTKGRRPPKERKFLNRERRELESLPAEIEALESEQEAIATAMADPATLREDPDAAERGRRRLAEIEAALTERFARWEELESLRDQLEG